MCPVIELKHITKSFGSNVVLPGLDLDIHEGEFITLLGPSGCGKTTLLRIIAGFEQPTNGEVKLADENITSLPPYRRNVNTVFQNYALFPHYTVEQNVAFGLRQKGLRSNIIEQQVQEALAMVQMEGFDKRKPSQLSGGQQQRIALARAIINRPKVLLLDEPLSALDLKLRKQMQIELKKLHEQLQLTFVFVTHDQEEALTMSNRIAVMNKGVIEQLDTPQVLYNQPKTKFVADFIGENNTLQGVVNNKALLFGKYKIPVHTTVDGDAYLFIRPEHIHVELQHDKEFSLPATIIESVFLGNAWKIIFAVKDLENIEMSALISPKIKQQLEETTDVFVNWAVARAVVVEK